MLKQPEGLGGKDAEPTDEKSGPSPPAISLPKGGGAMRGIGEKFASDPVTGAGSMTVPIAASPGRSGFGPQLALRYDSNAGNGPFGFGWSLGLPQITRKTDKGLPQYRDAEESDVFLLSGAEDLAPVLVEQAGQWQREELPPRTLNGIDYRIQCYRPRIEGLFARIERWTAATAGESHWRSISRDNVTTLYGRSIESRIADPARPERVFAWLICESYDDKGNAIIYHYQPEDSTGVALSQAHERNRTAVGRSAGRYLKRIRYGNRTPRQPGEDLFSRADADWFFELVFDYEEGHYTDPLPDSDRAIVQASPAAIPRSWPVRKDPFSTYRAGFEIRAYRLCRRVLMFHHIPDTPADPIQGISAATGYDGLVRATQFKYAESPVATLLTGAMQSGFAPRAAAGQYLRKSLPPVEFAYSQAEIHDEIREIDASSLDNLPMGLDGSAYQWVDLDGEGLPGILTAQAGAWFYKRNLSPISAEPAPDGRPAVRFQAQEIVEQQPSLVPLGGADHRFVDLAGDGRMDLVEFDLPTPGFYERTSDGNWEPFRAFDALPNLNWDDSNLRFIDLTGDGLADILITEDEALLWHPSRGESGFGPAARLRQFADEEKGPHLVFAGDAESIFLADMSGDGLTDLVRVRNGEVCYWPNLGYGRFGAKIALDASPCFDAPDQFDPRRLRLADIDGSGTVDILYLGGRGVAVFLNQAGNGLAAATPLTAFPPVDNLARVQAVDLFGNGTACLVWSSPLPGASRQPLRYIDLMGGQKPHLLVKTINNLGAETQVSYAPSTRFYLQDKFAGKPWVTRLPFPVHCVEKVTVTDKWRQTVFSTAYSYHHGYFDGVEREFRGFGRVEQVDTESYGKFADGNVASPYITQDQTLYQPPVKTVTWSHTGAFLDRERILSQFEHEYFPRWFEDLQPDQVNVLGGFQEHVLPPPDLAANGAGSGAEDLNPEEWRQALRACKGMTLRQEIYELDADALERGEQRPVKLFSAACHNCHIQRLQPLGANRHAVFLVTETEAISYHYELDLRPADLSPDPCIVHTLNLQRDELANVLQAVTVVYPRTGKFEDDAGLAAGLTAGSLALIHQVQQERHLAYAETRFTKDVVPVATGGALANPDTHRLRAPCEVLTYELSGIKPKVGSYFTFAELRDYRLSLVLQSAGASVAEIPYHQLPSGAAPEKRAVESARTLFFADDLSGPLPLGESGQRALVYEAYRLTLTEALLGAVYGAKLSPDVRSGLSDPAISGYLSGAALAARFPGLNTIGQYWVRSGVAGFAPDAAQHFYLPERYIDPFGNVTLLRYDPLDLFVQSSTDAMGSATRITRFDFRVLAPREIKDINDNLSEAVFDALGLPTAVAVKGKGSEGDDLTGMSAALIDPELNELTAFFVDNPYDESKARGWLGHATARHVYYFGETRLPDGSIAWGTHPACACGILRERHLSQLAPGEQSPLQAGFEYSDGLGAVLAKKTQAEPDAAGTPLRWVVSGKTIFNNKGRPVKRYEPYFSPPAIGHRFEEPAAMGVTAVIYYDAAGRVVRTESPDGSYGRVEFSPWHSASYDANDTVLEPGNAWFARRTAPPATAAEQRAAQLAADHAGTPTLAVLDSLARPVISIVHNRVRDAGGILQDEKYLTFTKLDAEGKPLWIRDARKNLVVQYITPPVPNNQAADPSEGYTPCYDIAGGLLFQHGMDAGDRWLLNDARGKRMYAWNSRGHRLRAEYDSLHRPTGSFVRGTNPANASQEIQFEKIVYGETPGNGLIVDPKLLNLRGRIYRHHDTAGVITNLGRKPAAIADEAYDFKGNLLRNVRQLLDDYKNPPDWSQNPTLNAEKFTGSTTYDALNRPVQLIAPHSDQPGVKCNVLRPGYNEASLLERVDVWQDQSAEPAALLDPAAAPLHAVTNIDYDAKGQRSRIEYGNGVRTEYTYESDTFRLSQLLTTRPPGSQLQSLHYTYDPVGNVTTIRDDAQQTVFYNNTIIEASSAFTYDALYRLTRAEGREHAAQNNFQRDQQDFEPVIGIPFPNSPEALQRYAEAYEYDPTGNILRMRHIGGLAERWVRRYQYALDSNRLLATSIPGDPAGLPDYVAAPGYGADYAYDAHGNLLHMPHLTEMRWDFQDQLQMTQRQKVNASDTYGDQHQGERTWYVYDSGGQRVRKMTEFATGALKTERLYLGGLEIFRRHGANPLVRETLHVMDDQRRIALVETRTQGSEPGVPLRFIRYQFGNHLGSVSLELDDQAQIITYEEYSPYGTTTYQAARSLTQTPKRYRFTGKERDEESGLYYHGARYYPPWLGRWINCDPIGMKGGTNLYAYVSNNPLVFTDPTGTQEAPANLDVQQWIKDHPQEVAKMGPVSDEWLNKRAAQEIAKGQRQADSGKPSVRALDPGCKPLPNGPATPQKRGPALVATPSAEFDYIKIEGEDHKAVFVSPDDFEWLQSLKVKGQAQQIWYGLGSTLLAIGTARAANQSAGAPVPDARSTQHGAPVDNTPRVAPPATRALPPVGTQLNLFPNEPVAAPKSAPSSSAPSPQPEIPFKIDLGEVKSNNWSVDRAIDYQGKFVYQESLDVKGGVQASLRYTPDHRVLVDLRELGGLEGALGRTYTLSLNPAEAQQATAGLRFGTSAYGNAIEPLVVGRVGQATGQVPVIRPPQQGGADFLPVQLGFRVLGFSF